MQGRIALAALVLASLSVEASASCIELPEVRPTLDDEVPTNTRVWIWASDVAGQFRDPRDEYEYEFPKLYTVDGDLVETVASSPEPGLFVLTPVEELELGAEYEIDPGEAEHFGDSPSLRFIVTLARDDVVPSPPSVFVDDIDHEIGNDEFNPQHLAWLHVESDESILWIDVGGAATFDPSTFEGEVSDVFDLTTQRAFVGDPSCGYPNWPGAERGSETEVSYAVSDLAGNLSEWTPPETVRLGCGCASGGQPTALALLLLPVLRRRWR